MAPQLYLSLALATAIGLSLGLLGSGGSIITLPVLVYVMGVPPQNAIAMSLAIVGTVSLFGALLHQRKGHFHLRAVLFLGLTGMVGAYFGSVLTHRVSPRVLMSFFSVLMIIVGTVMLRRKDLVCVPERCYPARCLTIGAGVGVLTGFLGVGGGFLIVPSLVLLAGIDAKKAIGASLGIIALNSAAGLAGQLRFAQFDWWLTAMFLAAALAGMWLGTSFVGRISPEGLRKAFAWSVVLVGITIAAATLVRV